MSKGRFVPSTEELYHWVHYGVEGGCQCTEVCTPMRRLAEVERDEDHFAEIAEAERDQW
jgi:hypothetical protein